MEQFEYTSIDQIEDKILGHIGSPRRDKFEDEVAKEIQAYHIGEAIKATRKERNLTQNQLADLTGIKKAQVSRIERGCNPTLNTITRAFSALGMAVTLICGNVKIPLS